MNNQKNWFSENIIPIILFALLTFIYSIRFFEADKMIFGHDIVLMGQYYDAFNQTIVNKHQIPYWIPYVFGGMPHQPTTGIFYPTYIFYFLLNFPWNDFILFSYVLHIFFAGFFMYLFARAINLSKLSAFIAGVFWMFCGNITTLINAGHLNNVHAIALIPLLFYFIEKGMQKEYFSYFIAGSFVAALQILAFGHQYMVYGVFVVTLYFIYRLKDNFKYKLILFFLAFILFIPLISALQFIPAFFYNKFSFRGDVNYEFFTSWSYHPAELITFLLPRFFGLMESTYWGHCSFWLTSEYFGILPLILAFVAVFFLIKDKRAIFFVCLTVLALILSFGKYTPLYSLLYKIPIINGFRSPARWLVFFAFSITVLSGIGFDFILNFINKKDKINNLKNFKKFLIIMIVLGVIFSLGWIVFGSNSSDFISSMQKLELIKNKFVNQDLTQIGSILYKMILDDMFRLVIFFWIGAIFVFLSFYSKIDKYSLIVCLLILHLVDVWTIESLCVKTAPLKQDDIIREEIVDVLKKDNSLYRVYPLGDLYMKNWFITEEIQSIGGYHGLPLKIYTDFTSKAGLNNINVLNLLNVKYLLSNQEINHPNFKLIFDKNVKIYENLLCWPRAYLVNNRTVIKNKESIYKTINAPDFNPLSSVILEEEIPYQLDKSVNKPAEVNPALFGARVKVVNYIPNKVDIEVNTDNNSMLVLSEVFYPEWKASLDGQETKIYPAYGLFRAIYVEKGKHNITFFYKPTSFIIGVIITIMAVIIALSIMVLEIKRKRYDKV
ncbi:MAG: YfhO family protein [Candidatus Firestonebacteria bacterium]